VRLLAATNHDLLRAVRTGTFREDLYFRLNVIPLAIPPLRDRSDDVPDLVAHFSEQFLQRTGQARPRWRSDALQLLRDYPWPGNVRELANIVERLAILHPGAEMTGQQVEDVLMVERDEHEAPPITPTRAQPGVGDRATVTSEQSASLADRLDAFERTVIARALAEAGGNVADAARKLQTDRPNLYRRMKRLGINATRV
jgi:two-component system nitrogen regulation response regulator NtrX